MSVRLLVYAGLSLFIIGGSYVFMVVCVLYVYNLTRRRGKGGGVTRKGMGELTNYLVNFSQKCFGNLKKMVGGGGGMVQEDALRHRQIRQ